MSEWYATGREAVYDICQEILNEGELIAPRGMQTKELLGCTFGVERPWDLLPTEIGREKLLPAIAAAELLQNIVGAATPELMHNISSFFPAPTSRWDAGIPTYGERIGTQLGLMVDMLAHDFSTRQAVTMVLNPQDPASGQMHNLCAIALQFMVRDDKVVTFAHMRSNDAWYGLCYDMFMFAGIGLTFANVLGLEVGPYFHTANSMHLYERHWEVAGNLTPPPRVPVEQTFWGIGRPGDKWSEIKRRGWVLLNGSLPEDHTSSELWLLEQIAPYNPKGK